MGRKPRKIIGEELCTEMHKNYAWMNKTEKWLEFAKNCGILQISSDSLRLYQ